VEIVAKAIILAKIGVEHGVPISANTAPRISGYKKSLLSSFFGISLIIMGSSKSIKPRTFNPIIKIIEATIKAKYGFPIKILPVNAHNPPIKAKIMPEPITKIHIWSSVFKGFASEYPPMYPIIKGNIESEQGESDEIKPPKNDAPNSIKILVWLLNNVVRFSIISIL
jgi:hypothetical protein